MPSSSNSNASSSDLYSPSDNPELIPAHPVETLLQEEEEEVLRPIGNVLAYPSDHPNDQLRGPSAGAGRGIVETENWGAHTATPSLHRLPNGHDSNPHHKRKRDEVEASYQGFQGHPSISTSPRNAQDSSGSIINGLPPQKRQLILEDWSRISRSNLHEEDPFDSMDTIDQVQPSGLPDEIWQHVFSFVPPVFLGRLLRVNSVFHGCLTKASGEQSSQACFNGKAVRPVSSNSVWAASRKRFAPGLPKPLLGFQELDMWRLLRGRPCQMCGETKILNFATSAESPLESGPGDKGVRVLWPFGIRTCGSCLQKCSEKVYLRSAWASCKFMTPC